MQARRIAADGTAAARLDDAPGSARREVGEGLHCRRGAVRADCACVSGYEDGMSARTRGAWRHDRSIGQVASAERASGRGQRGAPAHLVLRDAHPARPLDAADARVAHRRQRAHQHARAESQVLAQARQGHAGLARRRGQLAQDGGGQLVQFGNVVVVHGAPRARARRVAAGVWARRGHAPANVVSACWSDPVASWGTSMTGIDFDVGVPAPIAVDDSATSGFVSG